MSYEELKADVIKIGFTTRYEAICYLVALDIPIKAHILAYIARLVNEDIITE